MAGKASVIPVLALLGLGALGMYALLRPRIAALEKKVVNLQNETAYLNQKIVTLRGHVQSLTGFMEQQKARLDSLEHQVQASKSQYDLLIAELEAAIGQVVDEKGKKDLLLILARARRKAQLAQSTSG